MKQQKLINEIENIANKYNVDVKEILASLIFYYKEQSNNFKDEVIELKNILERLGR